MLLAAFLCRNDLTWVAQTQFSPTKIHCEIIDKQAATTSKMILLCVTETSAFLLNLGFFWLCHPIHATATHSSVSSTSSSNMEIKSYLGQGLLYLLFVHTSLNMMGPWILIMVLRCYDNIFNYSIRDNNKDILCFRLMAIGSQWLSSHNLALHMVSFTCSLPGTTEKASRLSPD